MRLPSATSRSIERRPAHTGSFCGVHVLMWLRPGVREIPGGHLIQMERTAEALRALGVVVTTCHSAQPDLTDVDVLHCFDPTAEMIRAGRVAGLPVVVSPIYCSKAYVLGVASGRSVGRRLLRIARLTRSVAFRGSLATAERIVEPLVNLRSAFEAADLLLPNSDLEARAIRRDLDVSTPMDVVPNGVASNIFTPSDQARSGVLYVARIDPHKNQLGLIQAMKSTSVKLTIVGPAHPHHQDYERACRSAAGSTVEFLDGRTQDDLVALYQSARVHAMPSWFETTGLSSLEAALCGCNVVTTDRGYASEYFDDLAWYCDPSSPDSIRAAVLTALDSPTPPLADRILDRYTWHHAAAATLAAYERLTPSHAVGH